ncbi:MAG TPA: hypothetical protein PKG71_02460 [Candidatus Woesebacteria bacterium]|jgi:hypothetical protein|nr:hypothetical protein [Candidatus Woesebacteria bacterium]HNS94807.1 hypothetical protein [Candidatus Woesebacteria bacterium]
MKKNHANPHYIGLFFGGLAAFGKGVWSLLVLVGFAQPILDFLFWLAFMTNPITIQMFELTRAVMFVSFAFAFGYVVGYVGAYVWNMLHHNNK